MDDTLIQFGHVTSAGQEPRGAGEPHRATVCPLCAQHFSPDGRFCPFDGQPLRPAPDWDPSADPLLGAVIDNRYEITALRGEGGMGVVYEARHRALGKRFALKALRKDLATDADIAARFMREARTAASVSHPGLVEITDFGRLPTGQPFFVMELLEGQSLAALIRRGGPVPASRAIDIVHQIADALGAAHDRSIVHRDLKPDNIHISPTETGRDRVTVVDFGLAKVIGASRLTRAGMVFGTPHYMSPEQAMGEATDHRADIYALGIVMYEMFTGRVPFEADSYMGVLTKHMYMAPTPPSQLVGTERLGVLEDITLRCLEKKPEHRYGSLRELTHDLDLVLSAAGGRVRLPRQRRATPRSLLADELELPSRGEVARRSQRSLFKSPLWLLLVPAGLFLAGIFGVLAARKPEPSPRARVPVASAERAVRLAAVAAVSAPQTRGAAAPALPSSSPAQPTASARVGGSAAAAPAKVPARSVARAVVLHSAPAAQDQSARLGGSEIVDPWAK